MALDPKLDERSAAGPIRRWTRFSAGLRSPITLSADWHPVLAQHAQYRLRALRAKPHGFLHPTRVSVTLTEVAIELPPESLEETPLPFSFPRWRDEVLHPLVEGIDACHSNGIFGLEGPVSGRWIPPVAWFVPEPAANGDAARREADLQLANVWLSENLVLTEAATPPERRAVEAILDALNRGASSRLRQALHDSRRVAAEIGQPAPPSILSLLTEGEFLEQFTFVYPYRLVAEAEARKMGVHRKDALVLEFARKPDPHFPTIQPPAVQDLWDELVDSAGVTPTFVMSEQRPNPLSRGKSNLHNLRWIGVHPDQSLGYVRSDGARIPRQGYVKLHVPGDVALMERKRAAARFAGGYPAVRALVERPPSPTLFSGNAHRPADLANAVLATRGVFVVQGPPGTGKTHLAVKTVLDFLQRNPGGRVLVCAKEHLALDHIMQRILSSLADKAIAYRSWRSLSRSRTRRGRTAEGEGTAKTVTLDLGSRQWAPDAVDWSRWQAAVPGGTDQRLAGLGRAAASLFFATTTDEGLSQCLGTESFDLVIVEEAGKCYPSELLHVLCLAPTVLAIGDQRQLPPYQEQRTRQGTAAWASLLNQDTEASQRQQLTSRFGSLFTDLQAALQDHGALTETDMQWIRPFEFLFDRLPTRHRLNEQFRMHPALSAMVASVFYEDSFADRKAELISKGVLSADPTSGAIPPELDVPLLWIDTPHMTRFPEAMEDATKTGRRDNTFERDLVIRYLQALRPEDAMDLVVLTPYSAQKRLLLESQELRALCEDTTARPAEDVVRTIDEFQGQEADVTVISLVRNNSFGSRAWGFVTQLERVNVLFSRARHRQVVVGCSAHIERHAHNSEWLHLVWQHYLAEASSSRLAKVIPSEQLHG